MRIIFGLLLIVAGAVLRLIARIFDPSGRHR